MFKVEAQSRRCFVFLVNSKAVAFEWSLNFVEFVLWTFDMKICIEELDMKFV